MPTWDASLGPAHLLQRLKKHLSPQLWELVQQAAQMATSLGQTLYLVGGAARDLLLGRPNLDLDLVVEGDAISLARNLARSLGGEVQAHPRFGTAKLRWHGLTVDLVTARQETYPQPGALPQVHPGSINDDLARRDFTINALAIDLCHHPGELVDPFHGAADLSAGIIRVLHERSFIDDATRMLRAVRYEQRLGFRLAPDTERLLRRDLAMLDTISGDRLRRELELILNEKQPERILLRCYHLGLLQRLHPSLKGNHWLAQRFRAARKLPIPPSPQIYLALLIYPLDQQAEVLIQRLNITKETARILRDTIRLKARLADLGEPSLSPSQIYRRLKTYAPLAIQAASLATSSPITQGQLQLYLNHLRYVNPFLDGEALKSLGLAPGRRLGRILEALREARLDGRVDTREAEEALVRQWLTNFQ